MRAIRQILSDRMLATAMAVVIAYVLALQGLTGGYARASTITPTENSFHVLCASTGIVDNTPDKNDDPLKKSAECPCALLCRLATSAGLAILPVFAFTIRTAAGADAPRRGHTDVTALSPQRRLLAEPRAPPANF